MKTLLPPKNDLAVALLVAAWIEFGRDAQHPVSADYPKVEAPLWSKWCALAADALHANGTDYMALREMSPWVGATR